VIYGIGVDIVKIDRFAKLPEKFSSMVLGLQEYQEYLNRDKCHKYLASRFAGKEAFIKAFGKATSLDGIQILNGSSGAPYVECRLMPHDMNAFISISDEEDSVVACVVLEKRNEHPN